MTSGVAAAEGGGGDIITMGDVTATHQMGRGESWCSSNQRAKGNCGRYGQQLKQEAIAQKWGFRAALIKVCCAPVTKCNLMWFSNNLWCGRGYILGNTGEQLGHIESNRRRYRTVVRQPETITGWSHSKPFTNNSQDLLMSCDARRCGSSFVQ